MHSFKFVVALCLQSERVAGGGNINCRKDRYVPFHITHLEPIVGPADEWPFKGEEPVLIRLKGTPESGGVLEEGGLYVVEVKRPLRKWKGVVWADRVITKIN